MRFDVEQFRAAQRPWAFEIGGQRYIAQHVSVPMVMEYQLRLSESGAIGAGDRDRGARAQRAALVWLLRCAFPWRPRYVVRRDPVRELLALLPAERALAMRDFFRLARDEESKAEPLDEWDALSRANMVQDANNPGQRISLEVAYIHCEQWLGPAFVHAPARWRTADGYVPVRVLWAHFTALQMMHATNAMNATRGIGLAFAGEESRQRLFENTIREMFPDDETQ